MKNKFFGSILIVAGTTIGGGMLAMPIISAAVGYRAIALILIGVWLIMSYTALLFVEIYQYTSIKEGFNTLTHKYLGNWASLTTGICMMALMYALLAAYISGGGDVLTENMSQWLNIKVPPELGILLFALLFGSIVSLGTRIIDVFNKWIFIIKIIFLTIVLVLLAPQIHYVNLLSLPISKASILLVLPVIFTSFGFHVNIPSIVDYMDGDQRKLKRIVIIGSAIPLAIYLLWQLMVLGSIEQYAFLSILENQSSIQGLLVAIRKMVQLPIINISFNVFAAAALVTSFLGVSLGLFDYIADLTVKHKQINKTFIVSLLTFVPPVTFALFYPEGFVLALGYAAIPLVFLVLFLPVFLINRLYRIKNIKVSWRKRLILLTIVCVGILLILLQIGIATGFIAN
ncbi:MAG TPA: aromatic amino acid transport family protein [Flavobacteriaceae bacterium]|nr:aromatic amino acid transport family protein [Flavobacteriaceae bacterium]